MMFLEKQNDTSKFNVLKLPMQKKDTLLKAEEAKLNSVNNNLFDNHFPIQNFEKILPRTSSLETCPVISPR